MNVSLMSVTFSSTKSRKKKRRVKENKKTKQIYLNF